MADRRTGRRWTRWSAAALLAALLTLASSALGAAGATPPHLLVPVGGGYSEDSLEGFSKVVIQHAHGATADILVVPSAYGDDPQQRKKNIDLAGQRARQIAGACNAVVGGAPFAGCKATLLILFDRNDALTPANSAAFNDPETDGAFILGGDQDIAMEVLAESPAETAMASAFDRGVVFGGTSAGAAVESKSMIAGFTGSNGPENGFAQGSVDVWWANGPDSARRGLIFGSQSIIYDQHFYQRGRFARLLNVVAASDDQFGVSRLGVGVDYATGVATTDDVTIVSPFGASSAAIIDFETAGATHGWVGATAPKILSARNVLTHIFAPSAAMSYDVKARVPRRNGQPLRLSAPPGWSGQLLRAPGPGALILGGDVSADWTGPAMAAFVNRAKATGSRRIVILSGGYAANSQAQSAASAYKQGLRAAGWTETTYDVDTIVYGSQPQWSSTGTGQLYGAAGVLIIAGDQSQLAAPLADQKFRDLVGYAVQNSPVVMTDRAMTAAMGDWYAASPEPTDLNVEDMAIAAFRAGSVTVQPGLGILHGVAFEPRLTSDKRWGRLYNLSMAHPDTIVFGIGEMTALVLDATGGQVAGARAVVALDGRAALFGAGDNGALSAYNVLLDVFGPTDAVKPSR